MNDKYCDVCGSKLLRIQKPANKLLIEVCDWGEIMYFNLGSKFDKDTGEPQYGILVKCPKSKWWNFHTEYVDEKSLTTIKE